VDEESNPFEKILPLWGKVYIEFLYLDFQVNRKANFYYENGVLEGYWAVP
jgi:hypothetical protein